MIFPLITHLAIEPDDKTGAHVSYYYAINIVGSFLGSFITGFILLEYLNIKIISLILVLLGYLLFLFMMIYAHSKQVSVKKNIRLSLLALLFIGIIFNQSFHNFYEKIIFKKDYSPNNTFKHILENRHGVITVTQDDILLGSGVYDGVYSIDLEKPEISPIINNPKIDIVIDDGRRWLRVHPDQKFDLIVISAAWHWRAYTSNLTSLEFQTRLKKHLKPGGLFYYNTTYSPELQRITCKTFHTAYRYISFMIAADHPFQFNPEIFKQTMKKRKINGELMINPNKNGHLIQNLLHETYEPCNSILARTKGYEITTEDNINIEFRTERIQ